MTKTILFPVLILFLILSCSGEESATPNETTPELYFPPLTGSTWETQSAGSLTWNENAVQPLLDYLELKHTKSFIILVDGKIVMENYFNGHTATTPWYWASAGKTLTAATVGIAQKEGYLDINDKVSDYLGTWTSLTTAKENLITNRHLLTMTSGLNDELGDGVSPANMQYVADAGTRWAYHNGYVKLQDVVANATNQLWADYFETALKNKIGMNGAWASSGEDLSVYWSNSRSMARFGLLMLAKGKWDNNVIIDEEYFTQATTTSQNINKSYGYLWWLNGKSSYHLPQTQFEFSGSIIPSAPADMFAALGKNDQKVYVVPSKRMVVIRMGDAADDDVLALSDFDDVLWQKINALSE